jgi:hypothetical protein
LKQSTDISLACAQWIYTVQYENDHSPSIDAYLDRTYEDVYYSTNESAKQWLLSLNRIGKFPVYEQCNGEYTYEFDEDLETDYY